MLPSFIKATPELEVLFQSVDYTDIKTVVAPADVSLREFLVGMFSYQPGWVTFLYRVRAVFVRLLGMRQKGMPRAYQNQPQDIAMTPGQKAAFFTVHMADENRYWSAEADDTHLKAGLLVVVEPGDNKTRKFYVVTLVYYHKWTGPVYFNIIRPFHHIVVGQMAKAGAKFRAHANFVKS